MVRRLVLGDGSLAHTVVNESTDRETLYVVTSDSGWVSTLRENNIIAREGDPADPSTYPDDVDIVLVAAADGAQNEAVATAARRAFPNTQLIASVGIDSHPELRRRLSQIADRVIDPTEVLATRILDVSAANGGDRLARLHRVLRDLSGPLGVFTHDNPDPDAIASAVALRDLAERIGVQADACYFGEISHQENRALVNLLDLSIERLETFDPSLYGGIALVDHSRPGINDSLPAETDVDIVIDHHPIREPVTATYLDLRSDVGSASTLLAEYFQRLGIDMDETIATALLYGIRIDTREFTREVSPADFDAAAYLSPFADSDALQRIESPEISGETLETVARAIQNREIEDRVLASCVGEIGNRDAIAQAADRLLTMEGITVTFVYGFLDGIAYGSARTRGADVDLGKVVRVAFSDIGSAGGHADMAGVQLPLGILGTVDDEAQQLTDVVRDVVTDRFFEAIEDVRSSPTIEFDTAGAFPED